jgi:hypothetical protein
LTQEEENKGRAAAEPRRATTRQRTRAEKHEGDVRASPNPKWEITLRSVVEGEMKKPEALPDSRAKPAQKNLFDVASATRMVRDRDLMDEDKDHPER